MRARMFRVIMDSCSGSSFFAKETRQWILRKVTTPVEYTKPSRNPTVADTSTSHQWSRQANASRSNFPTKIVQRDKNSNRNVE